MTILNKSSQRIDELERSLQSSMEHQLTLLQSTLSGLQKRTLSLDPEATLRRGYALVYEGGRIVKGAGELEGGTSVDIRFHDGTVQSTID